MTATPESRFASWMAETAGIRNARLGRTLTGGNANVTRIVESDCGRFVLRHPPLHAVSPKAAAGIEREYRLLSAVRGLAPVPEPVAWCDDPAVIGCRFAVARFVDGVALSEHLPPDYGTNAEVVNRLGEELIDNLAIIHTIDWRGRVPDGFGRPDGFLRRQIERWLDVRRQHQVRDLPDLFEIADWLLQTLPAETTARFVHCDYHLDNCLFDRMQPKLNAIIDWEMATIGDPMIDLGLMLMFWRRDEALPLGFRFVQRVSNRPDVLSPRALADRWSDKTGLSSERLDYYRVFAFWRLAAIVEGAYALARRGAVDSDYARGLESDVPNLLQEAKRLIG